MQYLAPVRNRIEKDVISIVTRNFPGVGKIFVQVGQEVSSSDIIAQSEIPSGFRIINISKLLSIPPSDLKKYLAKSVGQRIYKGELLAFKKGWLFGGKKMIISPTDGIIDFINEKSGEIKLVFLPRRMDLPSGVYGVVEEVDNLRNFIKIRTQVSKVYGLFGTGRTRNGMLRLLGTRDSLITRNEIKDEGGGQVFLGGSLIYKEAVSAAISSDIEGFIVGGINAKDYRSINGGNLHFPRRMDNDVGLSLIICEGFGSLPIGEDLYSFLAMFDGRFVFIDGNNGLISLPSFDSNSMIKVRATRVSENTQAHGPMDYLQLGELKVGMMVRVTGNFMPSAQGKLISIDALESVLPSGIKAYMATIETKYIKIKVPVNNLEILKYI